MGNIPHLPGDKEPLLHAVKGMYSEDEVLSRVVLEQSHSARQTTTHTLSAREKAAQALNEIKSVAEACGVMSSTLYEAAKKAESSAEKAKTAAVHAGDKIAAATSRALAAVNQEHLERAATNAERLIAALSVLDDMQKSGRLDAIASALAKR